MRGSSMRRMLVAAAAIGGLTAFGAVAAPSVVGVHAAPAQRYVTPAHVTRVDYNWHHHNWHHRRWERRRWRYWD